MGWVVTVVVACAVAVAFSSGTVVASTSSREERVRAARLTSLAEYSSDINGASKWWLLNGTNGVSGLNPCKPGVCVAVQDVASVGDCETLAVKYSADHPSQPCVTFTWHDNSVPCCGRECILRLDGVWNPVCESGHFTGHVSPTQPSGQHCPAPGPNPPPPPAPVLPSWEPTWNITRSTIIMPCNLSGYFDQDIAGRFAIVDYDWSNGKEM